MLWHYINIGVQAQVHVYLLSSCPQGNDLFCMCAFTNAPCPAPLHEYVNGVHYQQNSKTNYSNETKLCVKDHCILQPLLVKQWNAYA